MSVKLEIVPLSASVDMYGSVHTSSAYSLAGHVLITVTPLTSLFNGPTRPPPLRLTSLTITFEGKSESTSSQIGYAPARLCRITKDLVAEMGGKPITLSCAGGDASETEWTWSVLFDLAIPGWLPPSVKIVDFAETAYDLHAWATLETVEPPSAYPQLPLPKSSAATSHSFSSTSSPQKSPSTWSFSGLPTLLSTSFMRPKPRTICAAPFLITINRVRTPPQFHIPSDSSDELDVQGTPSLFRSHLERGSPSVSASKEDRSQSAGGVPIDLLRALEIVVSLPEFTGTEEGFVPLGLKVRCQPEKSGDRRLKLHEFEVEVNQVENFRSTIDSRFSQSFPIPPHTEQPPYLPLLTPHQMETLDNCGLLFTETTATKATRVQPLVPDGHIYYRPAGNGVELDERWARMDVRVPVLKSSRNVEDADELEEEDGQDVDASRMNDRRLRRKNVLAEMRTPFYRIAHEIRVFVKVSWTDDMHDGEEAVTKMDVLHCAFPLRFTDVPAPPPPRSFWQYAQENVSMTSFPVSPTYSTLSRSSSTSSASSMNSSPTSPAFSIPSPSSPLAAFGPRVVAPPPSILPAYCELFHENGDRKEDEGCGWLPPYQKDEHSDQIDHDGDVSMDTTASLPPRHGHICSL